MNRNEITAKRLKECREKKGETLEEIGQLVGVNKSTVMRWERGDTSKINIPTLQFLADHYRVPLRWLSGVDQNPVSCINRLEWKTIPYERGVLLPIIGTVRAGIGGEVQEEIIGEEAVDPASLQTGEEYFWLRVSGDSMTPSINDGDLVLVRRQETVENGQYAVILINSEEGLVKKVTFGSNWIELHSVNPYYPPRRFEGADATSIRILGRVIESRRKFA